MIIQYTKNNNMDNTILIIGSYIVTFLLGQMYGVIQAKKIVMKILNKYK
jgi:hypothetical protein